MGTDSRVRQTLSPVLRCDSIAYMPAALNGATGFFDPSRGNFLALYCTAVGVITVLRCLSRLLDACSHQFVLYINNI